MAGLPLLHACSGEGGETGSRADTTAVAPPTAEEIADLQQVFHHDDQVGRWTRVRPGADAGELTAAQRHQIKRLESLGYVSGSRPAPAQQSVTVHDPARAVAGLNLYTSGHAPEALLIDMDGLVVHRWAHSYWEVFPDQDTARDHRGAQNWRRARLLHGGDLLVIFEGLGLARLDRHSNLIWANHCHAHHDLEVLPDGDILVLCREAHVLRRVHPQTPILEDFVVRLGPDGREKERVSLLECFENSPAYGHIWRKRAKKVGDIFHTNSLELLDGRIADRVPEFTAGRVLVSILSFNTVAVVDLEQVAVVWALQNRFTRQHDATIDPDGNLMLFDNHHAPGVSAVLVLDPATGQPLREFAGTPERPFYSNTCGTSQPLPGGNILITESDNGRAFEIDAAGETVWEFYNPHRAGANGEFIATLFEMLRLPPDFPADWLGEVR
jgi:hypothetical protein